MNKKEEIQFTLKQLDALNDAFMESDIRLKLLEDNTVELLVYKSKDRKTQYINDIDLKMFNGLLSDYLQNNKNRIFKYMIGALKNKADFLKEDAIKELEKELETFNKI